MVKYQHGDIVHVAIRILSEHAGCYQFRFEGDVSPQTMHTYRHRLENAEIKHIPKPRVWKAGDKYVMSRETLTHLDRVSRPTYTIFYIDDLWVMCSKDFETPSVVDRCTWNTFNKIHIEDI